MIPASLLRRIRNDLPMHVTIGLLGKEAPPSKQIEGCFRFLCPHCSELNAAVNPKTNLAHCFCCKRNTNNIDLMLHLDYNFLDAVAILEKWLNRYESQQAKKKNHTPPTARK